MEQPSYNSYQLGPLDAVAPSSMKCSEMTEVPYWPQTGSYFKVLKNLLITHCITDKLLDSLSSISMSLRVQISSLSRVFCSASLSCDCKLLICCIHSAFCKLMLVHAYRTRYLAIELRAGRVHLARSSPFWDEDWAVARFLFCERDWVLHKISAVSFSKCCWGHKRTNNSKGERRDSQKKPEREKNYMTLWAFLRGGSDRRILLKSLFLRSSLLLIVNKVIQCVIEYIFILWLKALWRSLWRLLFDSMVYTMWLLT